MAVTSVASGTEHTLTTQTTAGVYVLVVDMVNMVVGDITILRIKTKYTAGGTSRLAYIATFAGVQSEANKYSIPVPVDAEIICTLEQTDGTGRDFYWNLILI
jgi:hypothetical protein